MLDALWRMEASPLAAALAPETRFDLPKLRTVAETIPSYTCDVDKEQSHYRPFADFLNSCVQVSRRS